MDNKKGDTISGLQPRKASVDLKEEVSHIKNASHGDIPYSGPLEVSGSSGFAWAKRRLDDSCASSRSRSSSRSLMFEPSVALNSRQDVDLKRHANGEVLHGSRGNSRGYDSYELSKHSMMKSWSQLEGPDSFDASDGYHSQDLSLTLHQREELATKRFISVSSSNTIYWFYNNLSEIKNIIILFIPTEAQNFFSDNVTIYWVFCCRSHLRD